MAAEVQGLHRARHDDRCPRPCRRARAWRGRWRNRGIGSRAAPRASRARRAAPGSRRRKRRNRELVEEPAEASFERRERHGASADRAIAVGFAQESVDLDFAVLRRHQEVRRVERIEAVLAIGKGLEVAALDVVRSEDELEFLRRAAVAALLRVLGARLDDLVGARRRLQRRFRDGEQRRDLRGISVTGSRRARIPWRKRASSVTDS